MKIYIRSMSEPQKEMHDKIKSVSEPLDNHIIKLLLYPEAECRDHWIHEVWAVLHYLGRLKGSNKFPKEKFIYSSLSVYNDILDQFVVLVKEEESELTPEEVPLTRIVEVVDQYQRWIARCLSSGQVVTRAAVREELEKILG